VRGRRRVVLLSGFGLVAGLVVWGSAAFACSPNARLSYPAPREPEAATGPTTASGPAGSEVTLYGAEYVFADSSAGPVQVVWNSLTPLASVAGPSFSVRVKIPDAAPGLYFINAVMREPNGDVVGSSSVTYRVTAPATAPSSGGASSTGPSSEPSTQTQTQSPAPTGEAAPTAPSSQSSTSNAAPEPVQTAAPITASSGMTSSGSTASPVAAPAAATAIVGPSAASTSPTRAPQAARPAGSPAATGAVPVPSATALASSALAPAVGPSLAPTAEGGALAGDSAQPAESTETKAMGLVDTDVTNENRRGSSFSVGVILLGVGLVTMFASFFAAHVRRRKALATPVAD
jgi:hypothetical protein